MHMGKWRQFYIGLCDIQLHIHIQLAHGYMKTILHWSLWDPVTYTHSACTWVYEEKFIVDFVRPSYIYTFSMHMCIWSQIYISLNEIQLHIIIIIQLQGLNQRVDYSAIREIQLHIHIQHAHWYMKSHLY